MSLDFIEVEHKYLLDADFDPREFLGKVRGLSPKGRSAVQVDDTYYLCAANPSHIYRHRKDEEIQHLTLKGLGEDSETRLEVNLDLGHHKGDQGDRVRAFLEPLGIQWSGAIQKNLEAYYFSNCEVVYYEASFEGRLVKCIEVEAVGCDSLDQAKKVIADFEAKLSLDPDERCLESLFHLLLLPSVEKSLQESPSLP